MPYLVQPPLALIGMLPTLGRAALTLVGKPFTRVRDPLPLVGDPLALIGDPVSFIRAAPLVGQPAPFIHKPPAQLLDARSIRIRSQPIRSDCRIRTIARALAHPLSMRHRQPRAKCIPREPRPAAEIVCRARYSARSGSGGSWSSSPWRL